MIHHVIQYVYYTLLRTTQMNGEWTDQWVNIAKLYTNYNSWYYSSILKHAKLFLLLEQTCLNYCLYEQHLPYMFKITASSGIFVAAERQRGSTLFLTLAQDSQEFT